MSLNWKEINLILDELDLEGAQIQKIIQSNFQTLELVLYGRGGTTNLLIVISPGVCRLHATRRAVPKNDKPLRFAELLKSRVLNARIEKAAQIGTDRIVRFSLRRAGESFFLYVRLWSNAANVILTGEDGGIIDAMRRLPKRGEISGGVYSVTAPAVQPSGDTYTARELPGEGSFNDKIDLWYAEHGKVMSLETLRAEARKNFEGSMARLSASLEHLRAKEADYREADRLKEYGGIILSNIDQFQRGALSGGIWLDAEDYYHGGQVRIKIDPKKTAQDNAAAYFEQYRKAKSGLARVQDEISAAEAELDRQRALLAALLEETNPLRLQKRLKSKESRRAGGGAKQRPGLSFMRDDWLLIVGRDASENDELLRRHVKGNDLWLHARDFPGSYVFVKSRAGKTVPLNILIDAGNLALFYSKGRAGGKGDLFYTPVKYLRRAKNGPKGLVLPTQEKNLAITLDEKRLKELELCRVNK